MIIVDTLIIGGINFVLDKVMTAVDREMNDDSALREELIAAQMRLELGEISDAEFARVESDLFGRIREIRERQMSQTQSDDGSEFKVTGAEVTFEDGGQEEES